jgi:5-methyltetrahydrofolate--homocysteine methyltransferase
MLSVNQIDWTEIQQRFEAWWRHDQTDSPLLHIVTRRENNTEPLEPETPFADPADKYLDVAQLVLRRRNFYRQHRLMAEAWPQISLDLGPGSLALYLGSEPGFAWDTVWFNECVPAVEDWPPLLYRPDNYWLQKHLAMFQQAKALADDHFVLNMPDLIENIDILAAMRGPQNFIYDMVDEPDLILQKVAEVDEVYFQYFDLFHDLVQFKGGNSYTAFNIWGPGRTAKVQCDICALLSPEQFNTFVVPSLRKQCRRLDHSLYHLDGPDAIKHVPALMEIAELDALQWTCGAGQPDGASDRWLPIYDQVHAAGKSIWVMLYDGDASDWLAGAKKLIRRYGPGCLYFNFPIMSEADGAMILRALRP